MSEDVSERVKAHRGDCPAFGGEGPPTGRTLPGHAHWSGYSRIRNYDRFDGRADILYTADRKHSGISIQPRVIPEEWSDGEQEKRGNAKLAQPTREA